MLSVNTRLLSVASDFSPPSDDRCVAPFRLSDVHSHVEQHHEAWVADW
ncbi:hypothetical protein IWQ52_005406 [Labrenzia sp. EL_159]|nr:hypothetical protein [Labrenzia sp. EL_162]MBG6197856.1 hypothetical protein [Labrenzia sp. EL_159]